MKRTFIVGGISAGLLASALVSAPAQAADEVPSVILANTNLAAQQVAKFWLGEFKANLIGATPYDVETKVVAKHISTGGPAADSKPGVIPAIGDEKKSSSKSKNVNLPKTSGKVFFIGADGDPHWCTGTSVQSAYRNLVATAGHCVYDTESNAATLDKWVFVPGYYQGKTPWGIYVGKQGFTHYDFDVYEDGDRDYAFVTVYNGVIPTSAAFDKDYESKVYPTKALADAEKARLEADKTTGYSNLEVVEVRTLKPVGTPGSQKLAADWTEFHKYNPYIDPEDTWKNPVSGTGFDTKEISDDEFRAPPGHQADGSWYFSPDKKTLYFSKRDGRGYDYFKRTFWVNIDLDYKVVGKLLSIGLKDVGRLGDNVGGQGLAYNQKVGKPVFVFGYPSGSHPDGNYAFSGKTLKWAYGKTFAASASAIKAEELIGIKSSFTGEGSIGSSWLLNYKSARRLGYLNGVTIGVSDTDKNNRYDTSVSPYFDGETYGVYSAAKNLWSGRIV
ncbi:hypothetical protein Aph01nite_36650 [Acrocarpospora phusangensis]|uniref:Peptidase n=1 Tax=Acrocarpospora phusangensis TaxID=1070424 RepID=A0A919URB1_9ACTN|nr:hypothetical protein [Acrocarpospora phusangensis]GIH25355.1 hypothetical protein Aph01nite_36650 [Acrocarpospora phusangensis]